MVSAPATTLPPAMPMLPVVAVPIGVPFGLVFALLFGLLCKGSDGLSDELQLLRA